VNVIILAAGEGKRINNKLKCLLKIKDKFLIEYSLDYAINLEPKKIFLVVSPLLNEQLRHNFDLQYPVETIIQDNPGGTMNALKLVIDYEPRFPIFLMLGDEVLINPKDKDMLDLYNNNFSLDGIIGYVKIKDKEDIKKTYSLNIYSDNVLSLEEKPKEVYNYLKGTGHCIISRGLFKNMIFSKEKNFVEAINKSISSSSYVKAFEVCTKYFNINTIEDLIEARNYLEVKN